MNNFLVILFFCLSLSVNFFSQSKNNVEKTKPKQETPQPINVFSPPIDTLKGIKNEQSIMNKKNNSILQKQELLSQYSEYSDFLPLVNFILLTTIIIILVKLWGKRNHAPAGINNLEYESIINEANYRADQRFKSLENKLDGILVMLENYSQQELIKNNTDSPKVSTETASQEKLKKIYYAELPSKDGSFKVNNCQTFRDPNRFYIIEADNTSANLSLLLDSSDLTRSAINDKYIMLDPLFFYPKDITKDDYKKLKVIKPAILELVGDSWKLKEKGEIILQ